MLIPYGKGISLQCPKDSVFCSMELSPDGRMYAIATTKHVQVWSAGPEMILLAQKEYKRSDVVNRDFLKRVFVVWKGDNMRFAVICGGGIISTFRIVCVDNLYEVDSVSKRTSYIPKCQITILSVISIDEYGSPLCVSTMESSILIGTNSGNLVEVEWEGIARGYPIAAPVMIYLPEVSKDLSAFIQILSLDYNPILHVLVLVLENGCCLLFHIQFIDRIHFTGALIISETNCTLVRVGSYSHVLAVSQRNDSVHLYRLSWKNDSLLPHRIAEFDLHRFDDLYPAYDNNTSHVTYLAWNLDNSHLSVGYVNRCVCVWNMQESIVWFHSIYNSNGVTVWSAIGDSLIYDNNTLSTQPFLISNDCTVCLLID